MAQTTRTNPGHALGSPRSEALPERTLSRVIPRLAGPAAFSPLANTLALLPLSVGSILNEGPGTQESLPLSGYSALGSFVVASLFFLIAGATVDRLLPQPVLARAIIVLAVYGMTELIRTTMFAVILARYGVNIDVITPHRLLGGALTGMAVIGVVAIVLNDRATYVSEYRLLTSRQRELERQLTNLNFSIGAFIDQLRESVRQAVDTALAPIVDESRKRHSVREVVDDIVRVSEDVVRPLSQQVSSALPTDADDLTRARPPRVSLRRMVELTTTVAPFQPRVVSLIIFLLFFSASVFMLEWPEGPILLLSVLTLGFATHWLGQRFVQPRLASWPVATRVVIVSAVYSAGFIAGVYLLLGNRGEGLTVDRFVTLGYLVLIIEFLSWGLATIPALKQGQREILDQTVQTTSELSQVRARAEVRLLREKQRLAATVHGDVQSLLMAAALRLQHPNTSTEMAVEIVKDTRLTIGRILDRARSETPSPESLESLCQRLVEAWLGVVEVTWDVDPVIADFIERDSDLSETLWQVSREAVANAVKHGRAHAVHLTLRVSPDLSHLIFSARDNGACEQRAGRAGHGGGSRLFDAVADSWEREVDAEGVTLWMDLPLSAHPGIPVLR